MIIISHIERIVNRKERQKGEKSYVFRDYTKIKNRDAEIGIPKRVLLDNYCALTLILSRYTLGATFSPSTSTTVFSPK